MESVAALNAHRVINNSPFLGRVSVFFARGLRWINQDTCRVQNRNRALPIPLIKETVLGRATVSSKVATDSSVGDDEETIGTRENAWSPERGGSRISMTRSTSKKCCLEHLRTRAGRYMNEFITWHTYCSSHSKKYIYKVIYIARKCICLHPCLVKYMWKEAQRSQSYFDSKKPSQTYPTLVR